jgi:hypothetical protein
MSAWLDFFSEVPVPHLLVFAAARGAVAIATVLTHVSRPTVMVRSLRRDRPSWWRRGRAAEALLTSTFAAMLSPATSSPFACRNALSVRKQALANRPLS